MRHPNDPLLGVEGKREGKGSDVFEGGWRNVLLWAALLPFLSTVSLASAATLGASNSSNEVVLAWTASPSPTVTGYYLNWGLASGQCTNQVDVGGVTNTMVWLAPEITYYFNVVAYDTTGLQSLPSNELAYPAPGVDLKATVNGTSTSPTLSLGFQAEGGITYAVQATQDFLSWVTIWTTNPLNTGLVTYQVPDPGTCPFRFYRLLIP